MQTGIEGEKFETHSSQFVHLVFLIYFIIDIHLYILYKTVEKKKEKEREKNYSLQCYNRYINLSR